MTIEILTVRDLHRALLRIPSFAISRAFISDAKHGLLEQNHSVSPPSHRFHHKSFKPRQMRGRMIKIPGRKSRDAQSPGGRCRVDVGICRSATPSNCGPIPLISESISFAKVLLLQIPCHMERWLWCGGDIADLCPCHRV